MPVSIDVEEHLKDFRRWACGIYAGQRGVVTDPSSTVVRSQQIAEAAGGDRGIGFTRCPACHVTCRRTLPDALPGTSPSWSVDPSVETSVFHPSGRELSWDFPSMVRWFPEERMPDPAVDLLVYFAYHSAIPTGEAFQTQIGSAPPTSDETFFRLSQIPRLEAVREVRRLVPSGSLPSALAAEWLLSQLMEARSEEIATIEDAIWAVVDPRELLQASLQGFAKHAHEEWLATAASLLETKGQPAWQPLAELVRSDRPECEYFVHAISNCIRVPKNARLEMLGQVARSSHLGVRWRVLEVAADLERSEAVPLLEILAAGETRDQVALEARDLLES